MLKFGLVVLLLNTVHGQEQFHREVINPSGPSQVILRGGALNSNGDLQSLTAGDPGQQVEERYVVADQPQEQAIPFQTVQESPIPTSNDPNNPFTQGENGFGLRLSQAPPASQVQQQVQQIQAAPGPQLLQQTHLIEQPAAVIDQPAPIVHHTEVNLPQLPAGQQYVDVYGRPINLEQPPQIVQQPVATAPPQSPAPQVQVQKQAFVDEYGRQLAQFEVHQQALPVAQQVVQQVETVPVAHHVQTAPVAHQVIQPATVPVIGQQVREIHEYNHPQVATAVAAKKVLSHSPLTLQTYAVPAVRNVGNLAIPYAQKITVAKQAPVNIVYPPTVPAPAVVKSTHRTVVSPVKLDVPVQTVQEVHAAFPEVHQVHHAVPAVEHQVHLAPAATHVEVHQPVQTVEHHQPVAFHHPQQLVHVEQHQPTIFAHHPQQLVHVEQQQQAVLAHHPQQLVHFEHQPQLIAQHPNLVHLQQPVAHHLVAHQPQAVVAHAPAVIQQPVATAAVVPAVAKVPVIEKTLVPEVTLIHQPVLPKALFQRHIFNVKHGSEPIVYQDLCTVYPYQKNLRACVLKKATLPELHHPDVRTINVEEAQPFPDQSVINPVPSSSPSVTVTKGLPNNIQETIRRESASARSKAKAEAAASAAETKEAEAEKEKGEKPSQPETAESRETRKSRRKKSKGSRRATEKPFELA